MKRIYTILVTIMLTASVFAQTPEKMSYQAIIRNNSDQLIINQGIGMQISILQGSITGSSVYTETQSTTTNTNGLVSIEIGTGSTTDDFSTIDWANGPYFIKTETDPTTAGGMNYTITGTSQLMSVPYALYAKTSGSSVAGPQGPAGIDGVNGINGQDGAQGVAGTNGTDGNGISSTTDNGDGTFTLNYTDGSSFTTSDLTGPQGVQGSQGPAGTDGVGGLTQAGTNVSITGAGSSADPYIINSTQLTETEVDNMVSNNGYLTTEVDGNATNEIQTISRTGLTVTLTDGGTYQDSVNIYTAGAGIDITNNVVSKTGHYIGELYGGGIVYYVYDNGQHGLIISLDDLEGGSGVAWSNIDDTKIGATAQDNYKGDGNTTAIIAQSGHSNSAAKLCSDYSHDGFSDWYLPSAIELREIDATILIIYDVLANDGDATTNPINPIYYWSSTEFTSHLAWYYRFYAGTSNTDDKTNTYRVRAVRAF